MFADGVGSPLDQGVATWLMVAAVFFGWIGIARLRGRAFKGMPRPLGWVSTGVGVTALVLAFVLPTIVRPDISKVRPSSTATIHIVTPEPGQVFHGNPATVRITIALKGGEIVRYTSLRPPLPPNKGHVHVYLDGDLISMTFRLRQTIDVNPGHHTLLVEFVAVDHAPWNPAVETSVRFDVQP
ncbi:MAG TPA: hypothetical protein VID47_04220 [Actinomycetota bacterium]|jgi:hypothetical protein